MSMAGATAPTPQEPSAVHEQRQWEPYPGRGEAGPPGEASPGQQAMLPYVAPSQGLPDPSRARVPLSLGSRLFSGFLAVPFVWMILGSLLAGHLPAINVVLMTLLGLMVACLHLVLRRRVPVLTLAGEGIAIETPAGKVGLDWADLHAVQVGMITGTDSEGRRYPGRAALRFRPKVPGRAPAPLTNDEQWWSLPLPPATDTKALVKQLLPYKPPNLSWMVRRSPRSRKTRNELGDRRSSSG